MKKAIYFAVIFSLSSMTTLGARGKEKMLVEDGLLVVNVISTNVHPRGLYLMRGNRFDFLSDCEGDVARDSEGQVFFFRRSNEMISLISRSINDDKEVVIWTIRLDRNNYPERILVTNNRYIILLVQGAQASPFDMEGVGLPRERTSNLFVVNKEGRANKILGLNVRGSWFSTDEFLYFLDDHLIPRQLNLSTLKFESHIDPNKIFYYSKNVGKSCRVMARTTEGDRVLFESIESVRDDRLKNGGNNSLLGMAWRGKGWGIFQFDLLRKEIKFFDSDGLHPLHFDVLKKN